MQGNQDMRARIAVQTISKEDVLRMNAERYAISAASTPSQYMPSCLQNSCCDGACIDKVVKRAMPGLEGSNPRSCADPSSTPGCVQGEAGGQAGDGHRRTGGR